MLIVLIITGGIVLTTFSAAFFDYLGKRRARLDPGVEKRVAELEKRVESAETRIAERDDRIAQLEHELTFVNKLIEDKTR